MRSRSVGIVALAALLALAGCAQTPTQGESPGASASATPTAEATVEPTVEPTPEAEPTEDAEAAVLPFDGDCAAMLTTEDIGALLGEGATLADALPAEPSFVDTVLAASGGLRCRWNPAPYSTSTLTVTALPISLVPEERRTAPEPMTCMADGGTERCIAQLAVNESWVIVVGTSEELVTEALPRVGARVADEHPRPAELPVDAWLPPACDTFRSPIARATGTTPTPGYPSDANPGGPVWDLLQADGRIAWCGYMNIGGDVEAVRMFLVPGYAAGAAAAVAQDEATVAGADAAWSGTVSQQPVLVVTKGTNVLALQGTSMTSVEGMIAIAEQVLPSLRPRPADTETEG